MSRAGARPGSALDAPPAGWRVRSCKRPAGGPTTYYDNAAHVTALVFSACAQTGIGRRQPLSGAALGERPPRSLLARVVLAAPGGRPAVTVWLDQAHQYLQIYTGDTLPDANARRKGIAIERYTCAGDAFNNRLGLEVLQPGETFSSVWGITAVR